MKPDDHVVRLFEVAGLNKYKALTRRLHTYNINTVAQLNGALNPHLPDLSSNQAKKRGLAQTYPATRDRFVANPQGQKIKRLSNTLKIDKSTAKKILNTLDKVNFPTFTLKGNQTVLSLGAIGLKTRPGLRSWQHLSSQETFPSQYMLPDYSRCGTVFDQGQRGTCVANATCSMMDYATGKRTSRQFVYHQCKMIDGIKNMEGTYISTAAQILSDPKIKDYGTVHEQQWKYCPQKKTTTHHGPPPENCYHSDREVATTPVFVRKTNMIKDIKSLLSGPDRHSPSAVVVGVGIFESFNNSHSAETGWITMPMEGERKIGGHAMLVVGWLEKETPYGPQRILIVRNSWGQGWAWNNPLRLPGHALMPFAYFQKYCHGGFSVLDIANSSFDVAMQHRLYARNDSLSDKTYRRACGVRHKRNVASPKGLCPEIFTGLRPFLKAMFLGAAWDRK